MKHKIARDMSVHADFVSADEEKNLMDELEVKFKRSRYQYDHWDDVINLCGLLSLFLLLIDDFSGDSRIPRNGETVVERNQRSGD